jgi:hypothetical protein
MVELFATCLTITNKREMLPQIVIGICKNTEYIVATHVAYTYEDFEYTIGE